MVKLLTNDTASMEIEALRQLSDDLVKLNEDNRKDLFKMMHAEFKQHYLQLFLGNYDKSDRTFHDWYALTGHRSTYVEIYDVVDGDLKLVYRVPPLINRNGLTTNHSSASKSIHTLLDKATKRALTLPRLQGKLIIDAINDADLNEVVTDKEAYEAWVGLLKYNGFKVKEERAKHEEVGDNEYVREEISWDEDTWDF